jgi:hypothetical protein
MFKDPLPSPLTPVLSNNNYALKPLIGSQPTTPLLNSTKYRDTKDPCVIYEGTKLHIFGSGGSSASENWEILHATADNIEGPWFEQSPSILHNVQGPQVAAPGVVYDEVEKKFHMFTQTACFERNGTIEHLISDDGGNNFYYHATIMQSIPGTFEDGIYDPHPAIINGKYYIVYSGFPQVGRPDIFLAESTTNSWYGPWERKGVILRHEDVPHHNQRDQQDYEWGLEGAQLVELPNGLILLIAVCFLPEGARGTRQRVFVAVAKDIAGPYKSLGLVFQPSTRGWDSGENGHASVLLLENELRIFYQARSIETESCWKYGQASMNVRILEDMLSERLTELVSA